MRAKDQETNIQYRQTIEHAVEYFSKILTEVIRKVYKEQEFEISIEEFNILEVIHFFPGIIQAEIAKKTLVHCSYVCKLLINLEENGFVKRIQKIKGKRQTIFENYLTESGEKTYKKIRSFAINEAHKAFENEKIDTDKFIRQLFSMADYLKERYEIKF